MITSTEKLKKEYEPTRLLRYASIRTVFYSPKELENAYIMWATTNPACRITEWDEYCDIRDAVPLGTNAKIRRQLNRFQFQ